MSIIANGLKVEETRAFLPFAVNLDMEADEIREAAHWRWQIENNVFKRLNEHCGSKHVRTSELKSFINWLQIIEMGLSLFDFLMLIIGRLQRAMEEVS